MGVSALSPSLLFLQLAPRLILTAIELSKLGPPLVNSDLKTILNEVFDMAVHSGVTKLRNVRLESMLVLHNDEREAKKRQKYESIMEELNLVRSDS